MAEGQKNYYILANSVEQFKKIEEAYNQFKECYALSFENNEKLLVLKNPYMKDTLAIYPENRFGKITELESKKSNLETTIIKSDLDTWLVSIGDLEYQYIIRGSNPDFKENK